MEACANNTSVRSESPSSDKCVKRGRKKGERSTKNRYIVRGFNFLSRTWDQIGEYPSLTMISEKLGISYESLWNLHKGNSTAIQKFLQIERKT